MPSNPGTHIVLRRFLRSPAGNIAIVSTLMIPVIVGFCGLAAQTSYWYYRHRDVQGAADIAAYGAAVVLRRGGDEEEVAAAAKADAISNGWRHASGTITVNQYGPFIEVLLTENQQRYFSQFFCGSTAVPISARAVAIGVRGGPRVRLLLTKEFGTSRQIATGCVTLSSKPRARIAGQN